MFVNLNNLATGCEALRVGDNNVVEAKGKLSTLGEGGGVEKVIRRERAGDLSFTPDKLVLVLVSMDNCQIKHLIKCLSSPTSNNTDQCAN